MPKTGLGLTALIALVIAISACGNEGPQQTATTLATATPSPTPTPVPTGTPTTTPAPMASPVVTPATATRVPPTPMQTSAATPTPTATSTPTPVPPTPRPIATLTPTPAPTPTPVPSPYIESQDGNILIMYEVPSTRKEMELDLKDAQRLTRELAKVYGRPPYGQLVLKKGAHQQWGESYVTVPQTSIPFDLCERDERGKLSCRFAFHELAHYFTWNLLRTDELWFNEGLSQAIPTAAVGGFIDLETYDPEAHDDKVYRTFPESASRDYYD